MRMQYKEKLDGVGTTLNLEELARLGARQVIALALEAEISAYMEQHQQVKTPDGKAVMERNGYHQE